VHLPLILQSLQAGAWVYCEKPLCGSLAEFDLIADAEAATGLYVSAVAQWRFGSAAQHVKWLIGAREFGRALVAHCLTLWYRDASYYQMPWRGKWATEFGGPTVALGIHLMDLMLWLLGDWSEVQAMVATLDRDIEQEDVAMALIRFEHGALGSITNSALSPRQETHLRMDFQRATVEVKSLYRASNTNWSFTMPEQSSDAEMLARWQAIAEDVSGDHSVQFAALLDSMDTNQRPAVSGSEARRVLEFIASLYKSAFTGQAVQRGSITPDDPYYRAMNGIPSEIQSL
jgi:predicted dehydrogenase